MLLPAAVGDFVAKDHLARFVLNLVVEEIDLEAIERVYRVERGQPPFDPAMMTALLLYAYCNGVYSSRRIANASRESGRLHERRRAGRPGFRTISEFRKRHLKALAALFSQVLKLCERAGLVKLGHVALDGTKIRANASKHKAMSYERMAKRAAELEAEWRAGWTLRRRRTRAKTPRSGGTRAARKCRIGSPTSSGAPRRSARAKVELEVEARAAAEAERKARTERKRSGKPRAQETRKAAAPPAKPPIRKRKRTSPIPRAAS